MADKAKRECFLMLPAADVKVGMMLVEPRKKVTKSVKSGRAVMLELGKDTTVTVMARKKIKILSC